MKIIYVNCGVKKNYTKEDHRSYIRNFCSCGKIAWKKNRACTGFEPLTCAIPMQRSTNFKSQLGAGRWISLDVYNKRKKLTCLWLKLYNKHAWRIFWLFMHQETIYNCWPSQCMNWYRMTVGVGAARVHKKWRGLFLLLLHFFYILKLPASTRSTVQTS